MLRDGAQGTGQIGTFTVSGGSGTIEYLTPNTPYDVYVRPMCPEYEDANMWTKVRATTSCHGYNVSQTWTAPATGTSYTSLHFRSEYYNSYYQIVYTPEELGLTTGEPRWITGVSMRPYYTSSNYRVDPRIYMAQTTLSSFLPLKIQNLSNK